MSAQQQSGTPREKADAIMNPAENLTDHALINDPLTRDDDHRIELREGYAQVGDVKLHYVEAGDGPLIVLLHGFPEFWFGWRLQIKPLAEAGFRVVAPDMRGYNLSSKPEGIAPYTADQLAGDVRGLIQERGAESGLLVGHDWGGTVAWATAMNHPEVVDRLAILNAAHPRRLQQGLRSPHQLRKSWYFFYFQLPGLPEHHVRADHWQFFQDFLGDARPAYAPEEIERYVEAWSQPGAAAAMINYYRAAVRPPKGAKTELRPISAPTLVIRGQRDSYLGPELAESDHDDVPNLDRVERLPEASHWVHHDGHATARRLLRPRPHDPTPPKLDALDTGARDGLNLEGALHADDNDPTSPVPHCRQGPDPLCR